MTTLRELWDRRDQTANIRVYQWVMVLTVLLIVFFGGIIGTFVYFQDQRQASRHESAVARYEAAKASYENDRDERLRCEQRVDGRDATRANGFVFIGLVQNILDTFSDLSGRPINDAIQQQIDDAYRTLNETSPPLSLADCPPVPTPPDPPKD